MNRKKLSVAIVDDEAMARKRAQRLLQGNDTIEVVHSYATKNELYKALEKEIYDLLFLDIEMPLTNGIELAKEIKENLQSSKTAVPEIVYITAFEEHALRAFEVGALDYLVKPLDEGKIERALEKFFRLTVKNSSAPIETIASKPILPISTNVGLVFVDAQDISHFSFDGTLVTIHKKGEHIFTDQTLSEFESKLPNFVRTHRRYLVNLSQIDKLELLSSGGYRAMTRFGEFVEISRQAARDLRKQLQGNSLFTKPSSLENEAKTLLPKTDHDKEGGSDD